MRRLFGVLSAVGTLTFFLASCATTPPHEDFQDGALNSPRDSFVFIVHGDGDYSYHEADGVERRADEVVLAQAKAIAETNPEAEVIVFHQKKRRRLLFLVSRPDGRAFLYRGGRLVAEESYRRDEGEFRFAPEVRIYEEFAGKGSSARRFFFYFGHEIPERGGAGYDASSPARRFTVDDLGKCAASFAGENAPFDLLILATCYGGTPRTLRALAPSARMVIASPENLHLSYFNLQPFQHLHASPNVESVPAFAERFARVAFETLSSELQTAVSVVVYDVAELSPYLDSVADASSRARGAAQDESVDPLERCDCARDSAFIRPEMSRGLTVYFQPPRFGRGKNQKEHSGWECWRVREPRPLASANP